MPDSAEQSTLYRLVQQHAQTLFVRVEVSSPQIGPGFAAGGTGAALIQRVGAPTG